MPCQRSPAAIGDLDQATNTEGTMKALIKRQRELTGDLEWYEWVMILTVLVPGAVKFGYYLDALIYVAKLMVIK